MELGVLAHQRGGEGVHADEAALDLAAVCAYHLVALEHLGIAFEHPFGDGVVFTYAALGQAAVHAVVVREDKASRCQQGVAAGSEDALALALLEDGDEVLIGLATPVGAGSVAAVMADIERFVSLRRLGVVDLAELVGIGIVTGPRGILHQGAHGGLGPVGLGKRGGHTYQQSRQESDLLHMLNPVF